MSQDMQITNPITHTDGSSRSPVRQEMPVSSATFHGIGDLGQDHEDMNISQYGSGEVEMMFNDTFFGNLTGPENSGQAENNEMDTAGQHEPAIKPEYRDDTALPAFSEDNCSMVSMDEGATNTRGDVALKREPQIEVGNRYQDLSFDYPMGEPGHDGEMNFSTLQHTSELLQDVSQDNIMNEESGHQGHELTDHTGVGEGEYGTDAHTRQDERGATIPTNEGYAWSEDPATTVTDFNKASQYAALQKNHEDVQSGQQWGAGMPPGTADHLLGPEFRETDSPSTFARAVESWHDHEDMQSRYEGNTMGVAEKETVEQHTQLSNTPLQGSWTTIDMNDIQHQAFGYPINFTNTFASPHPSARNTDPFATPDVFPQSRPPTQDFSQQQPFNTYNQSPVNALFFHQQQPQAHVEAERRQLENTRQIHEQTQRQAQQLNSLSFAQDQASVPVSFLMGPLSYQRAPQSGYRQLSSGSNNASHWPQMQSSSSQNQMTLNERPALYPMQTQNMVGRSTGVNRQTPGPSAAQDWSTTQQQDQSKAQQQDSKEESNDDEPLMTRTKHHPSITSQTSTTHQPSTLQPSVPPLATVFSSSPTTTPAPSTSIDWKLPQYDIQLSPTPTDPSQPSAKISLPGLVREELLLSPDHADQEIHLLVNVFLPGQRALTTPDPEPAVAVLNFHTIALMVIEAYVQYEIGDELGRRNPFYATPANEVGAAGKEEQEYERIRDARSVDVDDIFFAVVDRWRAGRESGKQSLKLIRGVQEFCDVALDVIYYVKEHGLLGTEGEQQEEEEEEVEEEGEKVVGERSKGKAKGKRKAVDKEQGVAMLKAKPKGKRAVAMDKAEMGARKKGRVAVKKEEQKKKKKGRKPAGITVVKK